MAESYNVRPSNLWEGKTERLERRVPQLAVQTTQPVDGNIERRHIRIDIPSRKLPVPVVARATLLALGWEDRGRAEKVAWQVKFDFEGHPFLLEDQKMGMNLHVWPPVEWEDATAAALGDRALATLHRAIAIAETDIFIPAIKIRVAKGEVMLLNNAGSLRNSYMYLRKLAREKLETVPPTLDSDDVGQRLVHALNFGRQRAAEQTALTEAMIVAFFAYLERYVTLALPFTDVDLTTFDLAWFLKATWSEKCKKVLDLSSPETKKLYDRLLDLADNYRNTRAHGHDKRGSTMGVFLEHIGTVPVMITGIEGTPDFGMDHYDDERFSDITATLDDVESLIKGPVLGNAAHWIQSSFDVRFFEDDVRSYRLPQTEYMEYYRRVSEEWERAVNFEY